MLATWSTGAISRRMNTTSPSTSSTGTAPSRRRARTLIMWCSLRRSCRSVRGSGREGQPLRVEQRLEVRVDLDVLDPGDRDDRLHVVAERKDELHLVDPVG